MCVRHAPRGSITTRKKEWAGSSRRKGEGMHESGVAILPGMCQRGERPEQRTSERGGS